MRKLMLNTSDEPKAEVETPKLTVESAGNHVYYYATVDSDRVLAAIKQIRELDTSLRVEYLSRNMLKGTSQTPIWLHIQSGGGSVFAGFAFADQLTAIQTPVYSIVEGYTASAATLISVACTKRFILPNAFMLIHQFSTFMLGKYEEFKDEMKLQDMAMVKFVEHYAKHTKMKRKEIKTLLQHDSWFDAEQCVKLGLADEIIGGEKNR